MEALSFTIWGGADRPDLARELEQSLRSIDPSIARDFARATFFTDNRRDLVCPTTPALLLQCAEDLIVPPAAAEYLHHHLPASTLRLIQATGHYPHVRHAAETI